MPILVEARYAKRLGLPGYSSHEYALTVRTEVSEADMVRPESARLYRLLQDAVDREMQVSGYTPQLPATEETPPDHGPASDVSESTANGWLCSARQKELILAIAEERQVPLEKVVILSQERFGKEPRQLSRRQASALISRLLTA